MKRVSGLVAVASALLTLFSFGTVFAALPSQPNFATAKAVSPFEIDLTWRDRANDADGFKIMRSLDRTNFQQVAQLLPGTRIYRDKNLFPDTRYFYRIRAFNAAGVSHYDAISGRTQTPVVPLSVAEWGGPITIGAPTNGDLAAVAAGAYHALGLKMDGTVVSWGQSTPPTNLSDVVAISAGQIHSLALKNDGTVVEWQAQFPGVGSFPPPPIIHPITNPIILPPIPPIRPIVPIPPVQPIFPPVTTPVPVIPQPQPLSAPRLSADTLSPPSGLTGVVAISAGPDFSLALKGDGTVVGWGDNTYGQTTPPADLSNVVEIAAGQYHSLALKCDGTVVQWGYNADVPTNLDSVVGIAAGPGQSAAVKSDGTVVLWGNSVTFLSVAATSNLTGVAAVALGSADDLALKKDGSLSNWSLSYYGATPPELSNSAVAISVNNFHHLALSTAPAVPSYPFITVLSANRLRLSWRDNSSDEKSFAIERSTNFYAAWTQIGTVGPNTTNFIDTTVQTNILYFYRVRALGKFGPSPYSTLINVMLAPLPPPADLTVTLGSTNHVNLAWYDSFSGIDSFKIERASDNNGQPGAWTQIASDAVTNYVQNTFVDSTIQPNNIYWYRVRAANVLGFSDYSTPVSINVAPPAPPGDFYGTPFADSINFYWYVGSTTRGVKIERARNVNGAPGPWTQIAMFDITNGNHFVDSGLPLGRTYWYRAKAYNWTGESEYTAPVMVTIVPPQPPSYVSANVGSTNGVDISWYMSPNDEYGFELERALDIGGTPGAWTQIATLNDIHVYNDAFHDTNVVINNTYWYRVRSFNTLGSSDYTTPVNVSLTTPPAPTLLAPTVFGGTVNLQWQEDAPNLSYFKIERAPDANGVPGPWAQVAMIGCDQTSYNDADVTPGAVCWYRVRAESWIGDSPYSNLVAATITPPAAPTIQSILLSVTNGVDLTITHPGDESGLLLEHAVPTALGFVDWTQVAQLDTPGYVTTYFTDTNVTANATNLYRVRAFNAAGISDYSPVFSIPLVPPAQPSLTVSIVAGTATVIWNDASNLSSQIIQGYRLQRALDVGGYPGTWTEITNMDANYTDVVYYDYGLIPTATYWYRVQAYNWVGNSPFSEAVAGSPTLPNRPSIQSVALSVTNHQVDVSWLDGANADGVIIERAPDQNGAPGSWSQIGPVYTTNYPFGSFSDTNSVPYTTNWYRMRSFSTSGLSDYSPAADVHIIPPSAPAVSTALFRNQVTVSWYDPAAYTEGIAGYKLERAPDINGSPGAWVQLTNTANTIYVDRNLVANTTYWYRVRSFNWVGDSDYSIPTSITIQPPTQPISLYGVVGTNHSVLLQWGDAFADDDGFKLERVADAGDVPGNDWQEIASIDAPNADSASFVDTNVTANTTNWYRVRAFNTLGLSDYSEDAQVRIMPPNSPTDVTAFPYLNTVQLYWFANPAIGNGAFAIQRATDNSGVPGIWADIATNVTDVNYTDTGLATGITYWYRVRAYNWVGSSAFTTPTNAAVTGKLPPAPPYALSGYPQSSSNEVFLSWFEYPAEEDGFNLQRAPDVNGGPGSWTNIAVVYATNSSFGTFFDTNFPADSTNWYRVQAFNSAGASAFSASNSVAVTAPAFTPTINEATALSPNRIDINWQGPTYGFIEGYNLERAPDNAGIPGAWTPVASGGFSSFSDFAVAVRQKYWYRVQSYNWSGVSPFSEPVWVVDAPPTAPSLAVTNDQSHQFTLNWVITDTNSITSVKIERAPDNGGTPGAWLQIAEPNTVGGVVPNNYMDIGIPTGETFWYRIRAVNAVGNSPYSNVASATAATAPANPAPQILSLTQTNGGELIEWSSVGGNTDVVQASANLMSGYSNLSPALVINGSGTVITNYFDAGALTNSPVRFYRIQSSR